MNLEQTMRLAEGMAFDQELFESIEDNVLEQYAKTGLKGEFSFSSALDDTDSFEEAVQLIVDEFKHELSIPFPKGLGDIPNEPTVYRFVTLASRQTLRTENLGQSWFADPSKKDDPDFWQELGHIKPEAGKKVCLVTATVPKESIDMYRTLWQRSLKNYENEVFINTDNQKAITVQKVEPIK